MEIQTADVTYPSGKRQVAAYLARPAGAGAAPGIVVIHEIFGLNDQIKDVSRRLAREGYAALAVDLFSGRSRAVCMARFMVANLSGRRDHSGTQDLKAALTFLAGQPGIDQERLGAIGFCLGGGFAIAWASTDERLKVIAPFYGSNPRPLDQAAARMCPVVGSYPEKDFTASAGRQLDVALDAAGVPHDIKIYPGAKHGFFNDQRPSVYDPQASADAWQRVLAYFGQQLRHGDTATR